MPWIPVPPATISFQGEASVHKIEDAPPAIPRKLLRGLEGLPEERAEICIIRIRPAGEFLTYGVFPCLPCASPRPLAAAPRSDAIVHLWARRAFDVCMGFAGVQPVLSTI